MLDTSLTEVSHKVGQAAGKVLSKSVSISPEEQQKYIKKYQALDTKEKQLSAQPDVNTGKYTKQFQHIHREKVKVARAGNLNAFGQPLAETASGGATSSGAIASVTNPFGIVMRRPSLFGYVKPVKKTHTKSGKNTSSHK
jgi:hypothetical protein